MEHKIALVTGGNRGIGLAVCRQLADAGCRVLLGSRDAEAGRKALKSLPEGSHEVVQLDVTVPSEIQNAVELTEDLGGLDILVNNAAIYLKEEGDRGALKTPVDVMSETIEVNILGPFRLCRALIPGMVERRFGRVVNISSGYGQYRSTERSGPSAYRLTKLGLNALTRMLADEVDGKTVKVNAVDPGWVSTRMGGSGAPRSPEKAAGGIVWAATLPEDGPNGGFFKDGERVEW